MKLGPVLSGVVLLVSAAASLHAQRGSKDPAASEACALLTKEDAAAVLGEAVGPPQATSGISMMPGTAASVCEYNGPRKRVHLNVWHASGDGLTMFRRVYKPMCDAKTKDGLAGIGDFSCWYSGKHEELQVMKGDVFFSIEMRNGNDTEPLKNTARKVLARIK